MSYAVKDFMGKDVVTVDAGTSVTEGSRIMKEKGTGYLIVLESARLAGIVTERDLVEKVIADEREPSKTKVSEIMSTPLITVDPDVTLTEAVKTMAKHGIRKLPVIRDDTVYGILTARDIARHFPEYEERVVRDLVMSISHFTFPR